MVGLTDSALRSAFRTVHKQNKFWRDLAEYEVTPVLSSFDDTTYEIDISTYTNWRDLAYLKPSSDTNVDFEVVTPTDLLDSDRLIRTNVVWGFGSTLRMRSSYDTDETYKLGYYKYPTVFPTNQFADWAVDQNIDVFIRLAAVEILGALGENEMKTTIQQMALSQLRQFISDNLVLKG